MSTAAVLDTFDDGVYSGDEDMDTSSQDGTEEIEDYASKDTFDEEDSFSEEENSVQAKEGEEIDEDSQVNLLEEQEEKGVKETEKKTDSDNEKSTKEDEDGDSKLPEDDASKDAGDDAEDIRNLKAFRDGKAYEVPEDAQVSVKINGKSEKVALKDLRDNYSGQVAYDKKFTELSSEREIFQQERDEYQEEINELTANMSEIRDLVVKGQNGEGHPLAGFEKLLDLMNINSVKYSQQMQERLFEEYDIFSQMSDAEREAYWLQKQNKYLVDSQESKEAKSSAAVARQEQQAQITALREAHNVSENDFNSAYEGLKSDGNENITAEQVIQTAVMTPLVDIGTEIMTKYEEQLSTDEMNEMVQEIAVTMYQNPDYTREDIESLIAEELEVETLVTQVNSKIRQPESLKVPKSKRQSDQEYESFDDWD